MKAEDSSAGHFSDVIAVQIIHEFKDLALPGLSLIMRHGKLVGHNKDKDD
jgi:hypothetical protein